MKIASWNVNGLRSAARKDWLKWFKTNRFDIVCLQETKLQPTQIPEPLREIPGYSAYFNSAQKKGYSGTAVYTKIKPTQVTAKLGLRRFDNEGRFLRLDFDKFILINLYLPHGGRQKENLDYKLACYKKLFTYLGKIKAKPIVLIGDFNIAHQEIDLARPKNNKNNIMFTPAERTQIDRLLSLGFADTFREFHKQGDYYTWWPYFANARERNLGWRIDYAFSSKKLTPRLSEASIQSQTLGSDHCPIMLNIKTD
ncbi:MAG: exodeoxyribonuclease III [Patescibacteria group bacterium]